MLEDWRHRQANQGSHKCPTISHASDSVKAGERVPVLYSQYSELRVSRDVRKDLWNTVGFPSRFVAIDTCVVDICNLSLVLSINMWQSPRPVKDSVSNKRRKAPKDSHTRLSSYLYTYMCM